GYSEKEEKAWKRQNPARAGRPGAVKTKRDPLPASPWEGRRPAGFQLVPATVPRAASIENAAARVAADAHAERPATEQPVQSKPDSGSEPLRWSDLIGEGNRLKFYGFLRLDLDIDSQPTHNEQAPLFLTSADPR